MSSEVSAKISDIRKLMAEHKVDGYVITHNNAHLVRIIFYYPKKNLSISIINPKNSFHLPQSEITPKSDERLFYITGFSGSNGLAVVTQEKALMWTDSRYYI